MPRKMFKEVAEKLLPPEVQEAQDKLKAQVQEAARLLDLDDGIVEAATGNTGTLCDFAVDVAESLQVVGEGLPLAANLLDGASSLREIHGNVKDGDYSKAVTATGAGAAEQAGNIVGFGAGDLAREVVRETVIRTAGEEHAPEKSGLRKLGEDLLASVKKRIHRPKP